MDGEIEQQKSFMDVFSDANALDAFLQSQDGDSSLNSAGSLLDMYLNRPPDFTTMQSDRNSKTSFSSLQKNAVKFSNAAFNFPSEISFNSEFSPPRAQPNFIMQQNVNINSFNDDCSPSDIYQANFDKKDVRSNSNLKNSSLPRRSKESSKSRGQRPLEISQNVELQKTDSRTNSGSNPAVLNQMIGSQTNINVIVNHTIFEPSTAPATPSITTFTDKTSSNPSPFMFINGAQLANQMQQNKPQLFNAGGRILPYNAVQKILESKQQLNQQKVIQQQHPLLQRKQQESLYLQQQQQIQQRLQQQQQQQQPIKLQQQQQLFQQYQQHQQRRIQLSQQEMASAKNVQTPKRVKSQTRRTTPIPTKKMAPANSPHTFVLNSQGLSLLNHVPQANHQNTLPQNNQTYLLNEVLRVTPTSSGNSNQNVLPSHFLVKQQSSSNPILISYPHINSATPLQNVVSGLTQPVVLGNGGQVNSIQQKQPTQIIIPSANVSNLNNIRFLIPQSVSFNNKNIAPKLLQGSQVVNLASAGNSNNLMPVRNLIPVLQQRQAANQQQVNAVQQFQSQNNQQLQSQLQQLVQQQQQQLQHLIQQQQQQRDKTSFQQLVQQFQSHASKSPSVIASVPKTPQPVIKPAQRNTVANRTKKISNEQPVQVPFFPLTLTRVSAPGTTTAPSVSASSNAVYSDAANNAFLMNSSVQQPKVVIIPHQVNSQSNHHPSSDGESLHQPAPDSSNKGTCFQDASASKTSRSPCTENELSLDEQFKIITANIKSLTSMANRSSREECVAKQLMVKRMEILKQIEPAVIERLKSTNPELFQIDLSFAELDSNVAGKPNISQDTKPKVDFIKISVDRINSEQLKKLRFVDVPLLQAHGLYEKELSEKNIAELLRLEEHVVRSLPAQQQNFVKNQVEIVKQILEKRVECEQSVQEETKVDLTKCKKEPDGVPIQETETTPSKEASTEEADMLKKIARCERFYKRLQKDHHNVLNPNITRPFSSFRDACDRLLCYHVYAKHENDTGCSNFDAEYSKISGKLLTKISNLKRRYRKLLLDECIVGMPTKVEKVLVAKLNLEMETENKGLFTSKWTEDCHPQKRLKLGGEILPIGCNSHVEALRMSYSVNKYGVKGVDYALKDLCHENDPLAENAFLDMKTMSDRHKTLDLTNSDSHDLSDDEELFNVFNNVLEFDAG